MTKQDAPSKKKIVFWNAAGSLCSAASSFLYLFIITRICGEEVAGDWSITIAIAQLMWTIGVFEATTYFATDAIDRFTSEEYFGFKFITCALMAVVSLFYVLSFHFDAHKNELAFWLCALKLVDAFGMYYFAAFQKAGRLDISGFSSVWQVLVSVISFSAVILTTQNVIWAVIAATLCKAIWIGTYNTKRLSQVAPISGPSFNMPAMKSLFIELLPLFVATFLANYLSNIPKYAIEALGTAKMQTAFSIIFMPSFVINLFLIFIMRPLLTPLANRWAQGKYKEFLAITNKIMLAVAALTAIVMLGSWLIGIPILQWVFKVDLSGCLDALLITMLGGGFAGASSVLYNDIIILRRQRLVLIAYAIAVGISSLIAAPLVGAMGLVGAAWAYLASRAILLLVYLVIFIITLKDEKAQTETA